MVALRMVRLAKKILVKLNDIREDVLRPFVIHIWPRRITPNMISFFRIFLAFVVVFMLFDYDEWRPWIIFLFSLGLFTDLLDGTMARTLKMETELGAIIDPVADKLLTLPLFFYLIKDMKALLFAIIGLEVFTVFMATVALFMKIEVKANIWGKWTFVFHATGLFLLLLFSNQIWANRILWAGVGLAFACVIEHLREPLKRPQNART